MTAEVARDAENRQLHLLVVGLAGSLETFLRWKFEGLASRGVRVSLAVAPERNGEFARARGVAVLRQPHWDEPFLAQLLGAAYGALRVGVRSPTTLVRTIRAARNPIRPGTGVRALIERLRSYLPLALLRPDVVHFEWNSAASSFLPMADVWGCPTVVSCHGSDVNVRPHGAHAEEVRSWLRASFAAVDAVHCVSDAIAHEAAELGMDPRRAWLIRTAVDPSVFHPAPSRAGTVEPARAELNLLTVADLRWLKGHEYALRAVRKLRDAGVPARLQIVGGDPGSALAEQGERERVVGVIERLGLGDAVELTGALPSPEVRDRLWSADVLLHLSLSEGLPTAVLEAMACGLPVVVSDCGGVREAVADGVEGFVVPVRDVDAAVGALQTLHSDRRLRQTMGKAGRERVLREFTLEQQLGRFMELYSSVARGERGASIRPAAADAPELRLLSAGPLSWTQAFEDAMQAVAVLRGEGLRCRYRIVGAGEHRDALEFARHQLALERDVEILEPVDDDWARLVGWADVFVDPSLSDAPLQALAAVREARLSIVSTSPPPPLPGRRFVSAAAERAGARHITIGAGAPKELAAALLELAALRPVSARRAAVDEPRRAAS